MDINPSFDISYVIQNLSRIDETFLLSFFGKVQRNKSLCACGSALFGAGGRYYCRADFGLFDVLKQAFSYIVVDTSANFDGKTITALDHSDLILLISIVNLPAIRNCQRCLELFERLGYEKSKTKIILIVIWKTMK